MRIMKFTVDYCIDAMGEHHNDISVSSKSVYTRLASCNSTTESPEYLNTKPIPNMIKFTLQYYYY